VIYEATYEVGNSVSNVTSSQPSRTFRFHRTDSSSPPNQGAGTGGFIPFVSTLCLLLDGKVMNPQSEQVRHPVGRRPLWEAVFPQGEGKGRVGAGGRGTGRERGREPRRWKPVVLVAWSPGTFRGRSRRGDSAPQTRGCITKVGSPGLRHPHKLKGGASRQDPWAILVIPLAD
jgi:hypothetical protein